MSPPLPPSALATTRATAPVMPETSFAFLLSAVSGFADTAGFILLGGIFTAHVTGNFVLAGAALAGSHHGGVAVRLALMPVFMLAVALASALARRFDRASRPVVAWTLATETLALAVFCALGVALDPGAGGAFGEARLFGVAAAAVVAMGVQNAHMREGLKTLPPTTMMTGNTTQFTLDLFARLRAPKGAASPELDARLRRVSVVLGGFLLGAAAGALAAATLRFWSALIPLAITAALAVRAARPVMPALARA